MTIHLLQIKEAPLKGCAFLELGTTKGRYWIRQHDGNILPATGQDAAELAEIYGQPKPAPIPDRSEPRQLEAGPPTTSMAGNVGHSYPGF